MLNTRTLATPSSNQLDYVEAVGRTVAALFAIVLTLALPAAAEESAPRTPAGIEEYLLNAEVVDARRIGTGVTNAWRLTLSDGTSTHDAAFQSIDQHKAVARLGRNQEREFKDSYHFNIAAYRLARLIGLDDMVPVTVKRRWRGRNGALTWWIPAKFDESKRKAQGARPASIAAWSAQLYRMRVFTELVHDTDRNDGNILYTEDWRLWMIDFTRAFRIWHELQNPETLIGFDEQLYHALAALDEQGLIRAMDGHLTLLETRAILARRDLILERFEHARTKSTRATPASSN